MLIYLVDSSIMYVSIEKNVESRTSDGSDVVTYTTEAGSLLFVTICISISGFIYLFIHI